LFPGGARPQSAQPIAALLMRQKPTFVLINSLFHTYETRFCS
jgi:hypothetical protein